MMMMSLGGWLGVLVVLKLSIKVRKQKKEKWQQVVAFLTSINEMFFAFLSIRLMNGLTMWKRDIDNKYLTSTAPK